MRFLIVLMVVVPRFAFADPELVSAAPGEDEALYHCRTKTAQVAVTFKPETDLKDLVTWAMGFTCKNFMFDPNLMTRTKKVTVIAPNAMSATDAYRVFLSALSTIGLTIVPKGNVLRIVEAPLVRGETVPIVHGTPDNSEQVVRTVIRPTYAQVATLSQAITAMKSSAGDVQTVGSVLLVTDYASNVRDMIAVIKQIDVPGGTEGIYTIPVLHADADKLAKELDGILAMTAPAPGDKSVAPTPAKMMVDARTNTLIVAASEAAYQRVRGIVERIDIAVETETGGSMHIYRLKAAIAEEVAKVLNDAIAGQSKPNAATAGKPGATTPAPTDALRLDGDAKVIPDKATNKLVVMSSGRDFIALKNVIEELDEPRKQIYIEALILEVQIDDRLDFGLSEHGSIATSSGAVGLGGVQLPNLASTNVKTLASANGLLGGLIGPVITSTTLLGTTVPTYGLLFQALGSNGNTKIMSAPSMTALDNEETKFQVGIDIPYSKGTLPISATNPTGITTTNIDRKKLVLELDIKPHISSGDTVLLEVKHANDDLVNADGALGPTWSTRAIETRVVVPDQQTVVIGGLMQEREIKNVSQVPILGDIPLLGYLFKYTTKIKKKTNLLVLLTPYIIKDRLDLELIRERRTREADEFVHSMRSLDGMKLKPNIDYRTKRGLIEEINRTIEDVEDETAERARVLAPPIVRSGPVAPKPD
jgi:general secretion pathway protein D